MPLLVDLSVPEGIIQHAWMIRSVTDKFTSRGMLDDTLGD
jgi:hypothetical protein